jgi:hypothetical protein
MRATLPIILSFTAAALIGATPAVAQRANVSRSIAPVVAPAGAVRTVASYDVVAAGDRNLPSRITVADSAGGLVAFYRLPGERTLHPMMVVVMGSDIVLQAETPAGLLTLELFDANDPRDGVATRGTPRGRWHLDGKQGELQGR